MYISDDLIRRQRLTKDRVEGFGGKHYRHISQYGWISVKWCNRGSARRKTSEIDLRTNYTSSIERDVIMPISCSSNRGQGGDPPRGT